MPQSNQYSDQIDPLDRLLDRIASAGADSVRPPGAAAARRRGRQRTVRRRLAASALALAVLAGAGGIAAAHVRPDAAGLSPAVGASTRATVSPTASPTPSAERTDASGGQHGVVPDPDQYVAAAWLGTSRLPYAAQAAWMQLDRQDSQFDNVIFTPLPDDDTEILPCGASDFLVGASGAQEQQFSSTATTDNLGSGHDVINADQSIYFYPDGAAANTAWSLLVSAFQCPTGTHVLIGVVGWLTAGDSSGQSVCSSEEVVWDPAGDVAIMHDCYVRHGSLIALTSIKVMTSDPSGDFNFTASDQATVQNLNNALQVYESD